MIFSFRFGNGIHFAKCLQTMLEARFPELSSRTSRRTACTRCRRVNTVPLTEWSRKQLLAKDQRRTRKGWSSTWRTWRQSWKTARVPRSSKDIGIVI